ncbi:MAG: MTH1187 family thiamine-binding protein [Bacteroidales bacterium]
MSVLMNFAIFPTDKGSSVSEYVSKVIKMIDEAGVNYKLTAMGTIIETETVEEALSFISKANEILKEYSNRIYCTATFDIRQDKPLGRMDSKINSVEQKIGKINK